MGTEKEIKDKADKEEAKRILKLDNDRKERVKIARAKRELDDK